jgi:hypothetical protein
MKYSTIFLMFSGCGLISAVVLMIAIFFKTGRFDIHQTWKSVLTGDKLSRLYLSAITAAFISAVICVFLIKLGA